MKLFRKIAYPRVVEFENGKFGVEVLSGQFAYCNDSFLWSPPERIAAYCLFDTEDQAISMCKKYQLTIKRQVYP